MPFIITNNNDVYVSYSFMSGSVTCSHKEAEERLRKQSPLYSQVLEPGGITQEWGKAEATTFIRVSEGKTRQDRENSLGLASWNSSGVL